MKRIHDFCRRMSLLFAVSFVVLFQYCVVDPASSGPVAASLGHAQQIVEPPTHSALVLVEAPVPVDSAGKS